MPSMRRTLVLFIASYFSVCGSAHDLFKTITVEVPRLTANSVTRTILNSGVRTDVPIWIELDDRGQPANGSGIIVLPLDATHPGQVIAPPSGYPSLVVEDVEVLSTARPVATRHSPTASSKRSTLGHFRSSSLRPLGLSSAKIDAVKSFSTLLPPLSPTTSNSGTPLQTSLSATRDGIPRLSSSRSRRINLSSTSASFTHSKVTSRSLAPASSSLSSPAPSKTSSSPVGGKTEVAPGSAAGAGLAGALGGALGGLGGGVGSLGSGGVGAGAGAGGSNAVNEGDQGSIKNDQKPSSFTSAPSSSSAATTSSLSCFSYNLEDPDNLSNGEDDRKKRAIAGRIYLERRQTPEVASKIATCTVSLFTAKPGYPGPSEITVNEKVVNKASTMTAFFATASYWAVPTTPACGIPYWTIKDTSALVSQNSFNKVNVDHVYEKSTLLEFFQRLVGTTNTQCTNFNALFNLQADPLRPGATLLTSVFAQLASYETPWFLGMDDYLNGLKGKLWTDRLTGFPRWKPSKGPQEEWNIDQLNNIGMIMSMLQDPDNFKFFDKVNSQIYEAFIGIDNFIKYQIKLQVPLKDSGGNLIQPTFAADYQTYINTKITNQNALISKQVSSLSKFIGTKTPVNVQALQAWNTKYNGGLQFGAVYPNTPNPNMLTFKAASEWKAAAQTYYLAHQSAPPCKRDGSACSYDVPPASATALPAATLPRPIPSPTLAPVRLSQSASVSPDPSSMPTSPLAIESVNLMINTITGLPPTPDSPGIAPSPLEMESSPTDPEIEWLTPDQLGPEDQLLDAEMLTGTNACLDPEIGVNICP